MTSDAHRRLRAATRDDHARLEARTDMLARIATPAGRRDIVARFHGLHAEAEAALAPWLSDLPQLEFETRRRTTLLRADLDALGAPVAAARAAEAGASLDVASLGEALGRMYVLEGSTLGGQVIRRAVEARGEGMLGLSFLDPYGERTGERWRAFLAALALQARTPEGEAEILDGAQAGFRHAEQWLCGAAADV